MPFRENAPAELLCEEAIQAVAPLHALRPSRSYRWTAYANNDKADFALDKISPSHC